MKVNAGNYHNFKLHPATASTFILTELARWPRFASGCGAGVIVDLTQLVWRRNIRSPRPFVLSASQ